ncbi:hypothetical protein PVAP13_3KG249000 [Panicum virgatum]|uniref:Uncharacterized protein n=1 Tax=Panicum virgatum TaxID=38727 RepID=A0A8T0V6Z0_PANVG|nr:hypothetical protein PVAP13_3KG249000 [Panicum virgatum]
MGPREAPTPRVLCRCHSRTAACSPPRIPTVQSSSGFAGAAELQRPRLRRSRRYPRAAARSPLARAAAPAPPPLSCGSLAAGPSCAAGPQRLWPAHRHPQSAACSPPPLPSSDLPTCRCSSLHGVPPPRAPGRRLGQARATPRQARAPSRQQTSRAGPLFV